MLPLPEDFLPVNNSTIPYYMNFADIRNLSNENIAPNPTCATRRFRKWLSPLNYIQNEKFLGNNK